MPSILITGANRGIGLELTRCFLGHNWKIFACCRTPESAEELNRLVSGKNDVRILRLDVTDEEQISQVAEELRNEPLDILFNNAGVKGPPGQDFGDTNVEEYLEVFRTNTLAPLKVAEAFVEQVAASDRKILACMGTLMGSLKENTSGGYYAYRSSKAALHMIVRGLAADLSARNILSVVFHPGWVRTRMGGDEAPLSVEDSAAGLTRVLLDLAPKDNGRFYDYSGVELPW
ncbi:SDR family oxidoreductase [Desulfuromonas sp. AOP6]|uniref:SDR family oxidoreductase n=1 Tax=Desulfuromonas sp. AOP6 TaxID=1566351 RepID=UPI0012867E2E|nr:SDR family oxidoreductase [Desulfuromonas sp. AOP6]BCA78258.1 short chain dehydrogenase [Desulfuromonas sp. AOP6]